MKGNSRLRRMASFGMMAVLALTLAACEQSHPNTTFTPHSEYGRAIDFLWDRLLLLGTIVFVLVEAGTHLHHHPLSQRESDARPPQTHGNVVIEIFWTLIPAFILLFIAVPTVRTIFKTQAKAVAGALEIDVSDTSGGGSSGIPSTGSSTANEIYLPRTHGELQAHFERRDSLVLDSAARRKARRRYESHELHVVHSRFDAGAVGVEWLLYRVLRNVTRENAVPRVYR